MLEQYPHYLYIETSSDPTVDGNGDMVPGESSWKYAGRCREETNGMGESIVTSDSKRYVFSSLVQMPAGAEKIEEGAKAMVSDNYIGDGDAEGNVRIIGICAKFDRGRLHCRMWI